MAQAHNGLWYGCACRNGICYTGTCRGWLLVDGYLWADKFIYMKNKKYDIRFVKHLYEDKFEDLCLCDQYDYEYIEIIARYVQASSYSLVKAWNVVGEENYYLANVYDAE